LKKNNPYYRHVVWDTASADEWDVEDPVLPCRSQEELPSNVQLSAAEFGAWMSAAATSDSVRDEGFKVGRAFLQALQEYDADANQYHWHVFRRVLAERRGKRVFRVASSVSLGDIIAVGRALGVPAVLGSDMTDDEDAFDLSTLPESEWPRDIAILVSELVAIKQHVGEIDGVVECGTSADMPADGDEKDRTDAVEELAAVLMGREESICSNETSAAAEPPAPGSGADEPQQRRTAWGTPSVAAPKVDDRPGQAISEEAEPPAPGRGADEPQQRRTVRGAPRVDAPKVDDRPGQAISEE
jgi:hypothetical protein